MIRRVFGWEVRKIMSLAKLDGSVVSECVGWGHGRIGRRGGDQRCQNHGCWLMRTNTSALRDETCY